MVRFYEFSDVDLDEDLAAALATKKKALNNQAKSIALRKKALKNRQARDANREAVQKMASRNRESK